jgi:hypothetical protein
VARELQYQSTSLTGQTLYAVIDFQGLRWNGTTFVAPTAANWATYALAMTEDTGTGHFTANMPAGIAVYGRLNYVVFHRAGGSPATTDTESARLTIIWGGNQESFVDARYDPAALCQGLLVGATGNSVTLDSWAPVADLTGHGVVVIVAGTGSGQSASISVYVQSTRVGYIDGSWLVTPDATSYVCVYWNNGSSPAVDVYGRVSIQPTGLDAIGVWVPSGPAATFPEMVVRLYRRFFGPVSLTTNQIRTYADDGVTVYTTQALGDDGITQSQGAAS